MIKVDLQQLIGTLSAQTRRDLERSAGRCLMHARLDGNGRPTCEFSQ